MKRELDVFGKDGCIKSSLLFGRIGVNLSSDAFDGVDDLPGGVVSCAFEDSMLDIMCHSVFFGSLVSRPGADHHTHVRDGRRCPTMDDFYAILQNMIKSLRIFLHNSKFLCTFARFFLRDPRNKPTKCLLWGERSARRKFI